MAELIVAVFDTIAHAEAAKMSLRNAGITSEAIHQWGEHEAGAPGITSASPTSTTAVTTEPQHRGFLAWVFGEEQSGSYETHEHRDDYESHLNAGRTILRIRAIDQTEGAKIMSILERHAPAELETEPTNETLAETDAMVTGTRTTPIQSQTTVRDTAVGINPVGGTGSAANQTSQLRGGEEVIPLSEERLSVGKRVIDKGTTRIRRYTTEQPVEESVTLRDERTTVDRRSPAAAGTDPTAFQDRVVEVTNTTEEAVVSKEARVVEEVVVNREATERTETVKDTVRREQVETDKDSATFPDRTGTRTTETPDTLREPPARGSAI